MLLTRIKNNILTQNWASLILEIIVLVVGIFLGFQLDNWNEDRKNTHLEKRYMERFYSDAIYNINAIGSRVSLVNNRIKSLQKVINKLESKTTEDVSIDDMGVVFCYWYISEAVPLRTTSYDELIASNSLALISNDELREQIQLSHSRNLAVEYDISSLNPISMNLGLQLQPYVKWFTFDDSNSHPNEFIDGALKSTCSVDVESLKGNEAVISVLTQLYRSQFIIQASRRGQLEDLKAIKIEIERYKDNH